MKRRIVMILLAVSVGCGAYYWSHSSQHVNAKIVTNDLHANEGTPARIQKDTGLYSSKDLTGEPKAVLKKGTVIRVTGKNTVNYNGMPLYLDCNNVISGKELTRYVVEHPDKFDKKVITTKQTKLYNCKDYSEVALVSSDSAFLIIGEDEDFYEVTFDESKALLYKKDAKEELYVKVTSYDNVVESFADVYAQLQELADSLGVDTSQFDYDTEAGNAVVAYALQYVGNPYVWGGTSLTDGCDCSGFVQQVYKHFGVSLPRQSSAQAEVGTKVELSQLQPGDLLFFKRGDRIGHVAMFAGNGMIVHAKGSRYGIVHEQLKETPAICRRFITEGNLSEK